ncbi:wall-associated receptor kinase-like 6 isoform X2 [Solanum stenotomum]|uniref:wall-associated receptor kinase-like 6 isoform X2 n=1 Tax=Solanum stenotomum TaxID=172797 RepID=UPI0020D1EB17|nr:wall-associated receptor kinase-like 6 isoform X2 [Solanum stenotomum]
MKMQITMWSFFILLTGLLSKETTQVSSIRIWSSSAILSSQKPGCPERCGNVTIPFPFGIGKKCYFNEAFAVSCDNNTAFSHGNDLPVQHISMDSITLYITFSPFRYNKSSGKSIYNDYLQATSDEYFSISNKNNLVAIGCDIYAYAKDLDIGSGDSIVSQCASFCGNSTYNVSSSPPSSSYCTGNSGCCQSELSKIVPRDFNMYIQTINTADTSWTSSSCNYYLVVEKGSPEFDFTQLRGKCKEDDHYEGRMALDWVIGNLSCDKATRMPKYACTKNSRCIDDSTRPAGGYRCNCSSGYEGNPYLLHGCQDIDECASPKRNRCPNNTRCVNTLGTYRCDSNNVRHMLAKQLSIGIGAAITFVILVAVCLWLHKWLRKREENKAKQKFFKRNGGLLLRQRISLNGESSGGSLPKLFLKEELEKATDYFNEIRILGKGGAGTVYKGMLSDGSIIAVKKSNAVDKDQIGQFINEILILSQINHRHIVKVLGCCLETQVPLLVYEYISNGTLSSHIHGNLSHSSNPTVSKSELDDQILPHPAIILSWDHRVRIAAEIAGALSYMHSCASTPILHRDIKSSNILLDDNFRAVVSDFGLSRLLSVDKTHLTTMVGGTFGYIDPEYFRSGQLTDKCDVYAFGVILAELLTSQRVVTSNQPEDPGLVIRFTLALKENRIIEIVDPEIVKEVEDEHVILAVAELAKRCLNFNARRRPSMKEVAAELEQQGKMRQDMPHNESFQDNISPKSESSCSHTSDCTEEDNQNSVAHNEMHYNRKGSL